MVTVLITSPCPSCAPLIATDTTFGIGVFWDIQCESQQGASLQSFTGVGLLFTKSSMFAGWADVQELALDPSRMPNGVAHLGDMTFVFGDECAKAYPSLHQEARK